MNEDYYKKMMSDLGMPDNTRLYQALKSEPPFPDIMAHVEVKRFAASETPDEQGGRVFDIECMLKPRLLVKPASPASKPK